MKNLGVSNDNLESSRGSSKYDANRDALKSVSNSYSGNNHYNIRIDCFNSKIVFEAVCLYSHMYYLS